MSDETQPAQDTSYLATPTPPPVAKTRGPRKNAIASSAASPPSRQRHNYQGELAEAKLEISSLQNKIATTIRILLKAEIAAQPKDLIELAVGTLTGDKDE